MSHELVFGFRPEDNFSGQAKKRIGRRFDPFPNFKKQDIISLLKILDIYEFDNETEEQGSCDEFYREVYYSESESIDINYNADSTIVEVIYRLNGGGC